MVDILVVAGCEVAVHAVGRQEGAGELRLGGFWPHFRLLCRVTVVLEPDLDLCGALRLYFASAMFVFFLDILEVIVFFPKNEKNSRI